MASPLLVMVAGPNGSGKSTLIHALRAAPDVALPARYVNADDLRAAQGLEARDAQRLAQRLRREAIAERAGFLYETVMSHPSKIAELQLAARAGYRIAVFYLATADPEVNIERVRLRVAAGGHPVPEERIRARHRRSVALAPAAIGFADHAYVYDNSDWGSDGGQALQAVRVRDRLASVAAAPAAWVASLMRRVNARAAELDALFRETPDAVVMADLDAGVSEGPMHRAGAHFALQLDRSSGRLLLHDRLLLPRPVQRGRSYRIAYREGVATVSARTIGAVRPAAR